MQNTSSKAQLEAIRHVVTADLTALDDLILQELHSDISLIQEVTKHIIRSGGKRLRPLVVILCAKAARFEAGVEHLELAAIIEFVHTATLLHDDVIDQSIMRRGQDTANAVYGNQASVLVGDFLYSRAFQILTRRCHTDIMQVLANTTNAIAEGEVLQLMNCNDPDTTEVAYYQVIKRKTAKLFESACEIGAMLASNNPAINQAAATYGLELGYAFQIIDDVMDYTVSAKKMGKNIGDDLAEGKPTLPLIYTLQHSTPEAQQLIRQAIKQGSKKNIELIVQAMQDCDAFTYCRQITQQHIKNAFAATQAFEDSPYKQALQTLCEFVTNRNY
jgi:octaprenyl-diphosphate synthase